MLHCRDAIIRQLLRCLLGLLFLTAVPAQTSFADTLRLLDDDGDALQSRFDLINSAQLKIDCACFELRADDVTYAFLANLERAAARGVEVRLIVDAYGNKIDLSVLGELVRVGVQVRRFHPLELHTAHRYLWRMHDKLLIADRRTLILGGRNLGAVYFGRSPQSNFVDRDVEIRGDSVKQAADYFEQLWSNGAAIPLCRCEASGNRSAGATPRQFDSPVGVPMMTPAALLRRGAWNVAPRARRPLPQIQVPASRLRFLHSHRIAANDPSDITDEILRMIDASRREILIETPYLVLSPRFERALRDAVLRGVSVRLLGNSLAAIDQPLPHAGYVNQKRDMLQAGFELWEFQGPDMLHAKAILVDDAVIVGSYDLHPRSEFYDTEVAMLVCDAQATAAIRDTMCRHFTRAVRVGRRPGYRQSRELNGMPGAARIFHLRILRLPALLLERHL